MFFLTEPPAVADYVPVGTSITKHLYSLADVADRLGGRSVGHVYDLIRRGRLRAVREGNRQMVLPADFDAYLASLSAEPRSRARATTQASVTQFQRVRAQRKTG